MKSVIAPNAANAPASISTPTFVNLSATNAENGPVERMEDTALAAMEASDLSMEHVYSDCSLYYFVQ